MDDEEAVVAAGVGAVEPLPAMPLEEVFFFLNWNRKLSSSSSVTALSELGVPKSVHGRDCAGLPAEPLAGVPGVRGAFGVRGAGDVNILESSRWGVPTVKSSSKSCRLEDVLRRCSKALGLLLAEFADFLVSVTLGPFPWSARKNLWTIIMGGEQSKEREVQSLMESTL